MPRPYRRAIFAVIAFAASAAAQGFGPGTQPDTGSVPTTLHVESRASEPPSAIGRDLGSLPLGVPKSTAEGESPTGLLRAGDADAPAPSNGMTRTLVALAGVVGLILTLAWAFKKVSARSGGLAGAVGAGGRAPAGLVEVLARYPIASRQTLVVLRFDRRVLLCCMTAGARGAGAAMSTLCELDDPEDVASVLLKTRDEAGESLARSFERSLREADDYAYRAERVEVAARPEPARAGAFDGGALARGLEGLWRGRSG